MTATDIEFELKEKLKELVKAIVESDDYNENAADETITILSALKKLKSKGKAPLSPHHDKLKKLPVPSKLKCPISGNLIEDPVTLANEKTYDRESIERWLNEVLEACPQAHHVLSHSVLNPNLMVKVLISDFRPQKPAADVDASLLTSEQKYDFCSLLYSLTVSSVPHQKEAATKIRQLTKETPDYRSLFKNPDLIEKLLSPISPGIDKMDPQLHEDLITIIFNSSSPGKNKKVFAQNEKLVSFLIDSVKSGTTMQSRGNAAKALSSLAEIDPNRRIIGRKPDVTGYLVKLLEEGDQSATKDANSAIHNLCYLYENKGRAVREGAIPIILQKIKDSVLVDELLATLSLLSIHHEAVDALHEHSAVTFLLGMIREGSISQQNKENCTAMLYTLCRRNREARKKISEDEVVNDSLKELAKSGTTRAKRKALCILEKLENDLVRHTARKS